MSTVQGQYQSAVMAACSMFAEIDSLPGAEQELPVADRDHERMAK